MFQGFGSASLTDVPQVSGWKTGEVINMSNMFKDYGSKNASFNAVPDVSGWDTSNVTNMSNMFNNYGGSSLSLNAVPNVSGNSSYWNTGSVENMDSMFKEYGKCFASFRSLLLFVIMFTLCRQSVGEFGLYFLNCRNHAFNLSGVELLQFVFGNADGLVATFEGILSE